ncbi:MAG: hypothetical protein ABI807_02290 [Sporichthyaceae bacterium]
MYTILLLTEATLTEHDARRIAELHGTVEVTVHLLAPADAEHNRLIEVLDEIALGRLGDAFDEDDPATPQQAELAAMHTVNGSLDLLKAAGLEAQGSVTGSDPVPAAVEAARADSSDEVIVVTPPHLVEAGLHRDWASRLRDELALPVLHIVAGTDRVIS